MASGRINCPQCNSLQRFSPKARPHPDRSGWVQRWATCGMCGFVMILSEQTQQDYEQQERDVARARRRIRSRRRKKSDG